MATTEKPSAKKSTKAEKKSVYEIVTAQVVEMLQAGAAPWRKPWQVRRPYNGKSKRPYTGLNTILLGLAPYSDPRWFTFRQIEAMGGRVEGEKGRIVTYWHFHEVEDEKTGKKETIPLLKFYRVFNASQIQGITLPELEPAGNAMEPLDEAQAVVEAYFKAQAGLGLIHGGDSAFYSPMADSITMPVRSSFFSVESYYATLFHEMAHSTGHKTRLDRLESSSTQAHESESYGKEELVAEMTAAFLANEVGISHEIEATVSYLAGWIKALQGDSRLLIQAASKAKKAADMILGIAASQEAVDTTTAAA